MTKEMFEWITAWQREKFTKATAQSAANHLREEVGELIHDLSNEGDMRKTESEYADCFLLLFGSASLYGLSYEDICQAINAKMEINKARKWGGVNEQGYVKHVIFNNGQIVFLSEDKEREPYTIKEYTGKMSRGPNRQLSESPVVSVIDKRGRSWEFREDSLTT